MEGIGMQQRNKEQSPKSSYVQEAWGFHQDQALKFTVGLLKIRTVGKHCPAAQ
jgi:hypothetical protein